MSTHKPPDPPRRKPYRRPVMRIYGDIRAITRAVGNTGAMDGGTMAGKMMTA